MTERDTTLLRDVEALVDPLTRGDPQSPLAVDLQEYAPPGDGTPGVGAYGQRPHVARLLRGMHYSLQANRKTKEGSTHPDRNAQFEYINERTKAFQARGQPVISVDTKKKELVGDFKMGARSGSRRGEPE